MTTDLLTRSEPVRQDPPIPIVFEDLDIDQTEAWCWSLPAADEVNEPFLREVLSYIETHPQRWDQSRWADQTPCGTTHCLAGWTYVLGTGRRFTGETVPAGMRFVAARLLGFTDQQAAALFHFTCVADVRCAGRPGWAIRHPTFAEFCARVEKVTGVKYQPVAELADATPPTEKETRG